MPADRIEQLEQLKQLPLRDDQRWQGGTITFPLDVLVASGMNPKTIDADPQELRASVQTIWAGPDGEPMHVGATCPTAEAGPGTVLDALLDLACDPTRGGYRPAAIEVKDTDLARYLAEQLDGCGIEVRTRSKLPLVQDVLAELGAQLRAITARPPLIEGRGVTPELVERFARAAAAFYACEPWTWLTPFDLVRVTSPDVPAPLSHLIVAGARGTPPAVCTLPDEATFWAFVGDPSIDQLDSEGERSPNPDGWLCTFGSIREVSGRDASYWHRNELPVANEHAYPDLRRPTIGDRDDDDRHDPPDAETLEALTRLLQALSNSVEADVDDEGRWSVHVETPDGTVRYDFELPLLHEAPAHETLLAAGLLDERAFDGRYAAVGRCIDAICESEQVDEMTALERATERLRGMTPREAAEAYPPRNACEQAEDLCFQAYESLGRRRIQLARRALELHPTCVDAYVILAETTPWTEEILDLYGKAIDLGRSAIERSARTTSEEPTDEADHETSLFRALRARARHYLRLERLDEAIEDYREIMELDPADGEGTAIELLSLLLETERDDEAEALVRHRADDYASPAMHYAAALVAYRKRRTEKATQRLRSAIEMNRLAGEHLADVPPSLSYEEAPESHGEAVMCWTYLHAPWEDTDGATEWLREALQGSQPPRGKGRQGAKGRKRRKKRSR